ncbi:MAG: O-antigen ligase family protein [Clostridia bacterium]|nr:O-antigen ligase family protein [Clostridia bacterium]
MKKRMISWLPGFVFLLFALQPVMDVASFWLEELGHPTTVTLLLRMGVLGLTVLLAFCLSARKRVYVIAAGICGLLFGCHVMACMQVGYGDLVGDVTNFVRVIQMPVLVLCLITFFRQNDRCFEAMQSGLTAALLVILSVEAVSILTGTDASAYDNGHGVLGWFSNANSQSANVAGLTAISLAWQLTWKKRRPVLFWATALGGLGTLYLMCTRLAYLGLVVITAGLSITLFLVRRKQDWKIAAVMAALCVLSVAVLPVSPLGHHWDNGNLYEEGRQQQLEGQLGENKEETLALAERMRAGDSLSDEEYRRLVEGLEPIYDTYVGDFVEVFGLEATMEMYEYSADILVFADVRPKKIAFAEALLNASPVTTRLFGVELSRFIVGENNYDVENDFHGIYYLYGIVGLAVYVLFLLYFVGLVLWALVKNAKRYFTPEAAGHGIAFLLCMAHAVFTAGVLRRPNASVYLSAMLAAIYYLVRLRQYPEEDTRC